MKSGLDLRPAELVLSRFISSPPSSPGDHGIKVGAAGRRGDGERVRSPPFPRSCYERGGELVTEAACAGFRRVEGLESLYVTERVPRHPERILGGGGSRRLSLASLENMVAETGEEDHQRQRKQFPIAMLLRLLLFQLRARPRTPHKVSFEDR